MNNTAIKILSSKQGETHLSYLGQAGFVLKSCKGTLLGIDLYLTCCVERVEGHIGYKRLLPVILDPSEINFDFIIATHPHFDHFDMDAIPTLMANGMTHLYASVNCENEVKRLMLSGRNVTYVRVGDEADLNDINVKFVFCDHGEGAPDAVGLIITLDKKKIYIAGDTCFRKDKAAEINELGPFDVMIAPINGAYGNLNEYECVELSKVLKPALTIPCHYGMFASHGGNPGIFINEMNRNSPELAYLLMTPGEQYTFK